MQKLPNRIIVALNGQSGSGKDTLAAMLVKDFGYTRLAFGDSLRQLVVSTLGPPALQDERQPGSYTANQLYSGGDTETPVSFKEAMLHIGGKLAVSDPCKLSQSLVHDIANTDGPVVVTDMRKPIEMHALANLGVGYGVYFVNLYRPNNPHKEQPLDNLLDVCMSRDTNLLPWLNERALAIDALLARLPLFHAKIVNNAAPGHMLDQLKTCLELTTPWQDYSNSEPISM